MNEVACVKSTGIPACKVFERKARGNLNLFVLLVKAKLEDATVN